MSTTVLNALTTTVVLYQGDDLAKIEELRIAAERGKSSGPALGGEPSAAKVHDDFVTKAEKRAVKVVLKALPRKSWRALVAAHPPRDGDDGDKSMGVNDETFGEALIAVSIASPVFPSDSERDAFVDSLRDADFERLYASAFALNRGKTAAPKADLSSRLSQSSETT